MPGYYHQHQAYSYREGFQNTGIEEGVTNFRALNPQGERQKIRFGTWLAAWNPATQSEAWRVEQTVDVPAELLAEADDSECLARGKQLYDQFCYMCHGVETMSGGVIPDLRFAAAATWRAWNDIVIGGVREQQGMRSFAGVMDEAGAEAIRAYVVGRTRK